MRAPRFGSSRAILGVLVVGLACAEATSCGSGAEGDAREPCGGASLDGCGDDCEADGDCKSGLFCNDGTCDAECAPGGADAGLTCDNGGTCGPSGRCDSTDGGLFSSEAGSGIHDSSVSAEACNDIEVKFEKVTPTVVLLVDQSGSMTEPFGSGGLNRWETLHVALTDPTTAVAARLENEVRFGLTLYTSHEGNLNGGPCPELTRVPPKLGNFAAMKTVFDAATPQDETPTGESLAVVAKELEAYPEPGPKFIILATDGEPDTCAQPNPQEGQAEALKAAEDAFKANIQTFIIAVGTEIGVPHLEQMANAGRGLSLDPPSAPYYLAEDQDALVKAFDDIIYGTRSCIFHLDGVVAAPQASEGTVTLDSEPLKFGDPDGWRLNTPTEIELLGKACERMLNGTPKLSVSFPCDVVKVIR